MDKNSASQEPFWFLFFSECTVGELLNTSQLSVLEPPGGFTSVKTLRLKPMLPYMKMQIQNAPSSRSNFTLYMYSIPFIIAKWKGQILSAIVLSHFSRAQLFKANIQILVDG